MLQYNYSESPSEKIKMTTKNFHAHEGIILGYYPLRGKIQVCRLLCQYLRLPYKDLLFTPQTWEEFKTTQKLNWNYQELPFAIDGDFVTTETFPISYYLIRKANRLDLLGKTAEDQAKVDMFLWEPDIMSQILWLLASFKNMELERKYQIFDRYWHEQLKQKFEKLESEADNQYYISYMTVVDFYIYDLWYFFRLTNIEGYMSEFPKLTRIFNNISKLPEIQSYENSAKAIKNICPAGFYEKWKSICVKQTDKID